MSKVQVLGENGWEPTTLHRLRQENVCRSIIITDETSTLHTVFRPARPRGMTPVAYYRKFKCVPEKYTDQVNGRFYCNPAHCSRSWTDRRKRDEHLKAAYALLG